MASLRANPLPLLGLLALAFLPCSPALARDTGRGGNAGSPEKNFSYVHADVEWVVKAFREAGQRAGEDDWVGAVRQLQGISDAAKDRAAPTNAAPYVASVKGGRTFEGAWIVARHEIVRMGERGTTAYETEFGIVADRLARRAIASHDVALLEQVADRYMPSRAGRAATLLLVDLALEAGDRDRALEWLEALEDLEDVSAEPEAELAPWRAARIQRLAHAVARDAAAVPAVQAALLAVKPDWISIDAVPWSLRYIPPPATDWRTSAGDARRSAVPESVGSALHWAWSVEVLSDIEEPRADADDSPSVWLPARAVTDGERLFVSDGQALLVLRLADGALLKYAELPGASRVVYDTDEDRRMRHGVIEGHALTVVSVAEAGGLARGQLIYVAAPAERSWTISSRPEDRGGERNDRIQAFHWDGKNLNPVWRQGGLAAHGGMDPVTRLYGAPVLYRGSLWVAGIRPGVTGDQWEAWLFALDPLRGTVRSKTHIGIGTPVRRGRQDEVVPTSVAADRGRVVVGTSLGMVAAVSARDGRVLWIHRYDRDVDVLREKRNANRPADGLRNTGFLNEPPVLALDRCFVTPVDAPRHLWLANRPRGDARLLETAMPGTTRREQVGLDMSIEHIAGVDERTGTLVVIGRGQPGETDGTPGPVVAAFEVVGDDPGRIRWYEPHPTTHVMEPWGRGLMTAREVFVPSLGGIAVYRLLDGSDAGLLDRSVIPDEDRALARMPYGNLIPIPGRGIVAVSATSVTFWRR